MQEPNTADERISTLIEELRSLDDRLRREMQAEWKRDLPLDELLFDRWERACQLGFGDSRSNSNGKSRVKQ